MKDIKYFCDCCKVEIDKTEANYNKIKIYRQSQINPMQFYSEKYNFCNKCASKIITEIATEIQDKIKTKKITL